MSERQRFEGFIAGLGTTSGTRIVVGRWLHSPYGPFADVMVEQPGGHRVLLAPTVRTAQLIGDTYSFDEVRLGPVGVEVRPAGADPGTSTSIAFGDVWRVTARRLSITFTTGRRMPLGRVLRAVPAPLAAHPAWAQALSPVAHVAMRGVRTHGRGRSGRRSWYNAVDLHRIDAATATFDGVDLGELAPVDPPTRFGFSSTPKTPSVTTVVSTVEISVT